MKSVKIKSLIYFAAGLIIAAVIWNLPLDMPVDGRKCLALSMMAVVWWATKAMDSGYVSLALLMGYTLLLDPEVVPSSTIYSMWSSPVMYLVISGFLISVAIKESGLGERIALIFIKYFVHSYKGVIISCYILGALLSFLIPHPWPRSFLLMSVMTYVIKAAGIQPKFVANIGLAVFAGSIPTSMILLTGDSNLNATVAGYSGMSISWGQWFIYMGIAGILASVLTCALQLILFKKPESFSLDNKVIDSRLKEMGKMSKKEILAIIITALAVIGWATDSLHNIHVGWVAVAAVIILSLPSVGLLDAKSWSSVSLSLLVFLCAAMSIGAVGKATGMNEWIVNTLMPSSIPSNPYLFAIMAFGISMVIHMFIGSCMATLGIVAPAIISFGSIVGISPLVCAMIAYTSVVMHWIMPFHHINVLIGVGDGGGHYSEKDVMKLGVPQTLVAFVVLMFQVFLWSVLGLV